MVRTQADQIQRFGQAACGPVNDVMHHDMLGTATGNTADLIAVLDDPACPIGDHPLRAADTERDVVA